MRIEETPPAVKPAACKQLKRRGRPTLDDARLERLFEEVRAGTYRVPAAQLSRRLVSRYPS